MVEKDLINFSDNFSILNESNQFGSISRIPIILEFDKTLSIDGEIIRFYAPITTSKLLKILPVQNKVHHNSDNFIYIETKLILGNEKSRSNFFKGDIAFLPVNNSICIFLKDFKYPFMNLIGKIIDIDGLHNIKTVNYLTIKVKSI